MSQTDESIFRMLGSSSHATSPREQDDYYATDPKAAELLLSIEHFDKKDEIWECACGEGHLSKVFENAGYRVLSTDLIDRGYGTGGVDFLEYTELYNGNIITNPPYKYAKEFCEHSLEIIGQGYKAAMLLRLQFLEDKSRRELFERFPPKYIYVSSSRLTCAKNGEFKKYKGSAVAYAWYVWEKGYDGDTVVRWFN